jgi:hypothetical protein
MLDIQAQIEREREMQERGRRRENAIIKKQMERDEAAALEKRKAGRKHLAAKLLVGVDPELAAYITVRTLIGAGLEALLAQGHRHVAHRDAGS